MSRFPVCGCDHGESCHARQGGPCGAAYCPCLGYAPLGLVPGFPTSATLRRVEVRDFLEWNLGVGECRIAQRLGWARSRLQPMLALLVRKGLARGLGPRRRRVYYPTRIRDQPFDAQGHYWRHEAPYGSLVLVLDQVGPLLVAQMRDHTGWTSCKVERLLGLGRRDGAIHEYPGWRPEAPPLYDVSRL